MLERILSAAPGSFGPRFLQWVQQVELQLNTVFADWTPTTADGVQQYAQTINQQVPAELAVLYQYADPVSRYHDGWRKWQQQAEVYRSAWQEALTSKWGMSEEAARGQVHAAPPLWPISCLEDSGVDWVAFLWRGDDLAVIRLDVWNGKGKPDSIGLRNHFLHSIVLELLADEETEPVDWSRLRRDPKAVEISGWPQRSPFPEHVALTIGEKGI